MPEPEQRSAAPPEPTGRTTDVDVLATRIAELASRLERHQAETSARLDVLLDALEHVHDDDRDARRRLRMLRESPAYETAFTADDPLVSVVIPTYDRVEALMQRSLPSALGQTHTALEVIVVGDQSPPATADALRSLDDSRVRFHNLTVRGPYLRHRRGGWLAAGTPGFNAGVAMARGLWIAPLGDDDEFTPDHVERLLAYARRARLEYVYGQIRQLLPDGSASTLGGFPPRYGGTGLQAALYHAGLRFMELEFAHALFGTPNDWGLIRRMMRAGVRMGALDEVTVTYWPSQRGGDERDAGGSPIGEVPLAADAALDDAHRRVTQLQEEAAELRQRLSVIEGSRSWRATAPLRSLRRRRSDGASR